MEDRQGQQLGNYKILHRVGQGGFADVYLGEHIHLRTQAAIKVLQVRLGDSNQQSFLNEARTIAHLIHPYIIRVLDFGIQDNVPFLVMDYAPNGTFRQRFLQGTPLPEASLVPFIKQAATALQYGHDKKLIHRDVKPENMLLGTNDEVLLSDFGLALIAYNSISRSLTETAGTAAYMAPEQLQGKPRPASDQYALAMIAYEWLTGSCPFQGSFFEIASQQVLAQPASIQEKAPGTAAEVEKVVMRALEKDPQQRFPNVREFALALEDACLPNKQNFLDLPLQPALMTDVTVSNNTSDKGVYPSTFTPPNKLQLLAEQEQSPAAQNSFSIAHKPQAADNNASFSLPAFPSPQIQYPDTQQEPPAWQNTPQFPADAVVQPFIPLAFPPEPEQNIRTPAQTGDRPFLDFPSLSPALVPDSADSTWGNFPPTGMPPLSTQAATPARDAYLSTSQKFQRNTMNHLKAVATPIYKDNQVQTANVIVIMFIIFIIVASGVGIFALSNNQKQAQQNSIATSVAAKSNTAKAQNAQNMKATQTAVVTNNPYLPTNGGVLVLNDPLTSNKNAWQVGPDATGLTAGTCAITTQGYEVDAPSVAPTPCFQTTQTFANFTYQVDLTFTAIGQSYSGGGIIFRSSSDFKQYYYFEILDNGYYTLQKCTEISCANYMDGYQTGKSAISNFQTGTNVTNTLAVVANGNTIDLFVNKQRVSEVTDQISAPYTTGSIGVLATAGNNQGIDTATNTTTTALFSNAKIWKL